MITFSPIAELSPVIIYRRKKFSNYNLTSDTVRMKDFAQWITVFLPWPYGVVTFGSWRPHIYTTNDCKLAKRFYYESELFPDRRE